jgi:hypothetical protein
VQKDGGRFYWRWAALRENKKHVARKRFTELVAELISLQAAVVGTAEGKQASAELQTQFAARSAELQNLQKQIEDPQAKLQSGQATLSDEERTVATGGRTHIPHLSTKTAVFSRRPEWHNRM